MPLWLPLAVIAADALLIAGSRHTPVRPDRRRNTKTPGGTR